MVDRQALTKAALLLAGILCLLIAAASLESPRNTPAAAGDGQTNLGQQARDIVAADQAVNATLGPDAREIGGVIWNASAVDIFYRANGTYYRVEVDCGLGRVTSVRNETDPEILAWLTNVSAT